MLVLVSISVGGLPANADERNAAQDKTKAETMATLSQHQIAALDAYEALQRSRPELFKGRIARPLVLKRDALVAYAAEHNTVLGVAAETPYVYFIVDLVESRGSDAKVFRHPYLRVVSRGQLKGGVNVVVIATIENSSLGEPGSVVLVDQERHALGEREIELPRGFGEPGLSGEANALKELEEETGYIGEQAHLLGTLNTDSGLTDSVVSFYHVPVVRRGAAKPETEEAIRKVSLASRQEIWKEIHAGTFKDGFTLSALALYEEAQRSSAGDQAKH
jgi:ADP-ribose pyrophosphatase